MNSYMPTNWTTQKRWTNFQKNKVLPRPIQEETDNLNRLITRSEIEFEILKTLRKQKSRIRQITGEFYKTYKEELIPILLKLFKKSKMTEHSQINFMRPPLP